MLVRSDRSLTVPLLELLHAVSGVERQFLERARIYPHTANWLHFPWYPRSRGGAFVLGSRIYLKERSLAGTHHTSGPEHSASLLLLAHEVGHLPQAHRFRMNGLGKIRYAVWAAGQYGWSALRNGPTHAHDDAPLEREADEGRWVLGKLMETIARTERRQDLSDILALEDPSSMINWLAVHAELIAGLRKTYQANYLSRP